MQKTVEMILAAYQEAAEEVLGAGEAADKVAATLVADFIKRQQFQTTNQSF